MRSSGYCTYAFFRSGSATARSCAPSMNPRVAHVDFGQVMTVAARRLEGIQVARTGHPVHGDDTRRRRDEQLPDDGGPDEARAARDEYGRVH